MANLSRTTRDHEEIRRWAEERGGKPAHVKSTGSGEDVGLLRIDFPGYSGEGSLEAITWDEFFDKFDERNLALIYQEQTAEGERSNFNKLVSAETAAESESRRGGRGRSRSKRASGRGTRGTSSGGGRGVKKSSASKHARAVKSEGSSRGERSSGSSRGTSVKQTGGGKAAAKKTSSSRGSRGSSSSASKRARGGAKKTSGAGRGSRKSTAKKRR